MSSTKDGSPESDDFAELKAMSKDELNSWAESKIADTLHDICNYDPVASEIAMTNAVGWGVDTFDVLDVEVGDGEITASIEYQLNGDQEEDKPWSGTSISGEATAVISPDGIVKYRDVTASRDLGEEDPEPDEADGDQGKVTAESTSGSSGNAASKAAPNGTKFRPKRESSDDELALEIEKYREAIAEVFIYADTSNDFVFALYAPWGRGKSKLMKQVAWRLEKGEQYKVIFFSAWKYPTRPEIWVHLYQTIAKAAQEEGFWQHLRVSFRVGLLKNGWWPLISGFALLAISRIYLEIGEWFFNSIGFIGILILGSFFWNASKLGKQLTHSYFSIPNHAEKLGLQAAIGQDLKDLLSVWTNPQRLSSEKPSPSEVMAKKNAQVFNFSKRGRGCWCMVALIALIWITLGTVVIKLHNHLPTPQRTKTTTAITLNPVQVNWGLENKTGGVSVMGSSALFTNSEGKSNLLSAAGTRIQPIRFDLDLEWNGGGAYLSGSREMSELPVVSDNTNSKSPPAKAWWKKLFVWLEIVLGGIAGAIPLFAYFLVKPPNQPRRVLLVVDDLDRCDRDQMLAVIDSLRLFLDDEPEMSRRMQVAMLLDRRILKEAIVRKGRRQGLVKDGAEEKFFREQEEKIFVANLQLLPLNQDQANELATAVIDKEVRSQLWTEHIHAEVEVNTLKGEVDAQTTGESVADKEEKLESAKAKVAAIEMQMVAAGVKRKRAKTASSDSEEEIKRQRLSRASAPVFSEKERLLLKQQLSKIKSTEITPRSLRTFIVRYQLARLILQKLELSDSAELVIYGLAVQLHPELRDENVSIPESVQSVIEAVAGKDV